MSKLSNFVFAKCIFIMSIYFGIYTGYFFPFWIILSAYVLVNLINIITSLLVVSGNFNEVFNQENKDDILNADFTIQTLIDFAVVIIAPLIFYRNNLDWYALISIYILFPTSVINAIVNYFAVKYVKKTLAKKNASDI